MHSFVTIVIPFEARHSHDVECVLNDIGNPVGRGENPLGQEVRKQLDRVGCVHFMSITPIAGDSDHSYMLLELTADGTVSKVISRIAAGINHFLIKLFETARVDLEGMSLEHFLRRHHIRVGQGWFSIIGANYDGTPDMTVDRIKQEHELATKVSKLLAKLPTSNTALGTLTLVRDQLWADSASKWAFVAEPAPILGPKPSWKAALPSVLASALLSLLWPFLLSAIIAFILAWCAGGIATGISVAVLLMITAVFAKPRWMFVAAAVFSLALGWFAGAYATAVWAATALLFGEFWGAYAWLRRREMHDPTDDLSPSAALVREIMSRENFGVQNHMAATYTIKPGWVRRLTLRLGLWVASQIAQHFSAPGFLGPTGVIHSARWFVLPGTDKLIFRSNFDGTWERYLEDFIELAYPGLNGIWSNTVGYPKTRNLFFEGAQDSDRLRRWMRRQQRPTLVWYSAYPQLTLARVRTNAAIRQGVTSALTEADAADWLSCFGSAPRPAESIELTEIPTLVFGGLRRLRYGTSLLLRLDPTKAKTWLHSIKDDLSFGNQYMATTAMLVGFSHGGLSKLGLKSHDLETFPVAFQQGSAAAWRARALSDTGDNAPEKWLWGGPGEEVDAILLIYAREQQLLAALVDKQIHRLRDDNHEVREVCFAPLPEKGPVREPFGYVDGISNPIIRGVGRWMLPERRHELVAPGEFILGYPDNLGFLPSSPFVAADDDPDELLPALPPLNASHPRPEFSVPQPSGKKDLGCNGTFLVVRHLEQDVDGFRIFLDKAARSLVGSGKVPVHSSVSTKEWVAAKLVGRWRRDGSSLIRHPFQPGSQSATVSQPFIPDNEFLYGIEDPDGLRCPFGAHIRRANPRESLTPSNPDLAMSIKALMTGANPFGLLSLAAQKQLAITNRHRILRVGRSYSRRHNVNKPGIIFMCLNTDIERQFEFVQKTWILGTSFHGLDSELDPLIGQSNGPNTMLTIPTPNGPLTLKRIQEFVTVLGSAYLFLPGRKAVHFLAQ